MAKPITEHLWVIVEEEVVQEMYRSMVTHPVQCIPHCLLQITLKHIQVTIDCIVPPALHVESGTSDWESNIPSVEDREDEHRSSWHE